MERKRERKFGVAQAFPSALALVDGWLAAFSQSAAPAPIDPNGRIDSREGKGGTLHTLRLLECERRVVVWCGLSNPRLLFCFFFFLFSKRFVFIFLFYFQRMKAGKCPTDELSLTNCAIVSPQDFNDTVK